MWSPDSLPSYRNSHFLTLTFLMNCVVAGISYFVYGYQIEPVILCILYCFLSSNVSDRILRSGKAAIKFEIVTQQPDEISQELIHCLGHSATRWRARGCTRELPPPFSCA